MAGKRIASVGSTATTRWPWAANHAASRPVPEPMSRMRLGAAGIRCSTARCASAAGKAFVELEKLLGLVGITFGATDLH